MFAQSWRILNSFHSPILQRKKRLPWQPWFEPDLRSRSRRSLIIRSHLLASLSDLCFPPLLNNRHHPFLFSSVSVTSPGLWLFLSLLYPLLLCIFLPRLCRFSLHWYSTSLISKPSNTQRGKVISEISYCLAEACIITA